MVEVYVIESELDGFWYTGMARDANTRLRAHNLGKNRFTKGHRPWKLIYREKLGDWQTARVREKFLKTAAGKRWVEKCIKYGGDSSSLPDSFQPN